jgi:hypothetical protein
VCCKYNIKTRQLYHSPKIRQKPLLPSKARSAAFDKVVRELGSRTKAAALQNAGRDPRTLILEAIKPIGVLRLYSITTDAALKFEELRYRFIGRDMVCDIPRMVTEVFNHSKKQRPDYADVIEFVEQRLEGSYDPWLVCCGHDFAAAMGKCLQHLLGSANSGEVRGRDIESRLRLAFGTEEFSQTDLYLRIKEWEQRNVPYVCLRF